MKKQFSQHLAEIKARHPEVSPEAQRVAAHLAPREMRLHAVTLEFRRIVALDDGFKEATRGKEFVVNNDAAGEAVFATRDLAFVRIASWATGLAMRDGALRSLKTEDWSALSVDAAWRHASSHAFSADILAVVDAQRKEAYQRLFPCASCAGRTAPNQHDVDALCESVFAERKRVGDVRNQVAHPHEREKTRVANLGFDELRVSLQKWHRLMNDLRLLTTDSSFGYGDLAPTSADGASARDLVDLTLLGRIDDVVQIWDAYRIEGDPSRKFMWQRRLAFYEDLHARHDAAAATASEKAFNDRACIWNDPT